MNDNFEIEIVKTLETKPELLPFINELLADLWALGSSPDLIVKLLRTLDLPKKAKVLDLGCGKGAVSIMLAHKLGFQILGVDGFKPFLKEAKLKAEEYNVSKLCNFEFEDIKEFIKKARNFDVVIYASIGHVLGSFDECIGKLRQSVDSGGYILIDDGFIKDNTKIEMGANDNYAPHDETLKQLTSYGDNLLREIIVPTKEIRAINNKNNELISKRVDKLTKKHSELADLFSWYLKNQKRECEILEKYFVGAIWLLQRK